MPPAGVTSGAVASNHRARGEGVTAASLTGSPARCVADLPVAEGGSWARTSIAGYIATDPERVLLALRLASHRTSTPAESSR